MYKLGPHLTRSTPQGADWAKRAAIVKSLDDTGPFIAAPESVIRVYRHFYQYQNEDARRGPVAIAREIVATLGGYNHPRLYLEAPFNEWMQGEAEIEYHLVFADECVAELHRLGYKVAVYCWGTGNPFQWGMWDKIKAHNFAHGDLLCLHEYWAKQGFTTWNALRYRRVHEYLQGQHPPMVITECGRDAIVAEGGDRQPGWKLQGISRETYAQELLAYAAELEKDPYVVGAVAYTFGAWNDFAGFESGDIADLMPAANQFITIAGSNNVSTIEFVLGFKDYAAKHPEVGTAVEDLQYDLYGNAWQHSANGLLFWHKAKNEITFFRK